MPAQIISERDAARYIGMSRWWMKHARRMNRGPAYLRIGRAIRYQVADLDAWLQRHRVQTRDSREAPKCA